MMPEPDGKQQAQPERQKQRIQHIAPENPAAAKQVQRNGSQQNQFENNFLQKHNQMVVWIGIFIVPMQSRQEKDVSQ